MNRIFAILTFGPILIWAGCFALVKTLGSAAGCRIDEAEVHPCLIMGRDFGQTAATAGLFATWGSLIFGRFVLGAGILWALVAGVRAILRRKS